MKKALFALSALLAAMSASAQSSVTLFGIVDMGLQRGSASGPGSTSKTALASGLYNSSRLGFRGVEDLGGGMSASFWLEAGVTADNGTGGASNTNNQVSGVAPAPAGTQGLTFARRSTVSLAGNFGEVRLGRDFVPQFFNIAAYDPFNNNGVGATISVFAPAAIMGVPGGTGGPLVRASNEVQYFTPKGLGGFWGYGGFYLGENPKNGAPTEHDGDGYGVRLGYTKGPFEVALGAGKTKFATTATTGDFNVLNLGGYYDFGVAKIMGMVGRDRRDSTVELEGRTWMVGALVPFGPHQIRALVARYKTELGGADGPEVKQVALGYVYNLSKRTLVYATAARVSNDGFAPGRGFSLGGSGIGATATNIRSTGYDLGIRHAF